MPKPSRGKRRRTGRREWTWPRAKVPIPSTRIRDRHRCSSRIEPWAASLLLRGTERGVNMVTRSRETRRQLLPRVLPAWVQVRADHRGSCTTRMVWREMARRETDRERQDRCRPKPLGGRMRRETPHTHHAYRRCRPRLRLARPASRWVPVQAQVQVRVQEWAAVCGSPIPTRTPTRTRVPNRLVEDRQTCLIQAQQVYEEPERDIRAMIHPDEPNSGDTKMRGE
jgi:hypothetical protein